jgi:hypothetical protein
MQLLTYPKLKVLLAGHGRTAKSTLAKLERKGVIKFVELRFSCNPPAHYQLDTSIYCCRAEVTVELQVSLD